jgi:hypothetical protein
MVLVALAANARAEEVQLRQSRGGATIAGLSLLALGLGGAGLGTAGLLTVSDAQTALSHYIIGSGATSDPMAAAEFDRRLGLGTTLAVAGWATAGLGLLGGFILILLDAPRAPHLAFAPVRGAGGLMTCSLSW